MSDSVTLASILGSQVSIQWFEGVAVVREVTDRLLGASSENVIPELQQIRLSAEGYLDITGVVATDEPVRRLGQLLQALVAHTDVPVQLRLIITQATAPTPPYANIHEYSEALGFFERPERSTVLSQLASRVTAAAATAPGGNPLTLDSVAPLPSKDDEEQKKKKKKPVAPEAQGRSRRLTYALVAGVILVVAGAGAYYARTLGYGPQNKEEASAIAEKASEAMGTAIVAGASKVTETLGLGRIVPAKEAPSPAPASLPVPPPAAIKATEPRGRAASASPSETPVIVAFDLEPRPAPMPRATAPAYDSTSSVPPSAEEPGTPDNDTIYSVNSGRVIPPLGVRPKLARQLPPDFDESRLGRIELIIGVDGVVESAKLLGPPRTVNDGMFLSVAKAWLFQPALKDGVPVRYRKTIWVASP